MCEIVVKQIFKTNKTIFMAIVVFTAIFILFPLNFLIIIATWFLCTGMLYVRLVHSRTTVFLLQY